MNGKNLANELKRLPEWREENRQIERTYEFADFPKAIGFVNGISVYAESKDHHPVIEINYNKVTLRLHTWSKGTLTKLDFEAAGYFDFLYGDQ